MAADGSIIIDTRVDTKGFGKGAANLKGQFAGLGAATKKLGSIIAAAFSVKVLVNFGKQALELGSDLQEVQNVVDVTFTTMNEQINEFAKNAATTAGLSEIMAKQYSGTFGAMAKSFKFTEAQAYTMATSLTQLAGDVASFYNLTQDEAYTKLKSVFTGETESLKDLGVVMTQTALDDYAMRKGLKKTTKQMSEQEKVALRYEFVLEQLAGASGDFLRTQDGWANQTRLLKLQFDQLKATIGQGLIAAFTPLLGVINQLLAKLQTLANAIVNVTTSLFKKKNDTPGDNMAKGYTAAANAAAEMEENTVAAGKAAEGFLAGFDEIEKISSGSSSGGAATGSGGAFDFAPTDLTVEVSTSKLEDNITQQIEQIIQTVMDLVEPLRNIDFSPLGNSLKNLWNVFKNFADNLSGSLGWVWDNLLVPLATWTIETAAPVSIDLLSSAFELLSEAISPVISGIGKLWDKLTPVVDFIKETFVIVLETLKKQFEKVAAVFREKAPEIERIFEGVGDIIVAVWEQTIKPNLQAVRDMFEIVVDFIGDLLAVALDTVITVLGGVVDFIAGVFTGDWERAWDGVKKVFTGIWNGIVGTLEAALNLIIRGINWLVRQLNKVAFNVPDWVPAIGGKTFGFNVNQIGEISIPRLATGAVIPPNREFLSVLGDQKNGNNLEAPESLIRKIVREEAGGMNSELLEQILQAIKAGKVIQVDKRVLGKTAAEGINDLTKQTGKPVLLY